MTNANAVVDELLEHVEAYVDAWCRVKAGDGDSTSAYKTKVELTRAIRTALLNAEQNAFAEGLTNMLAIANEEGMEDAETREAQSVTASHQLASPVEPAAVLLTREAVLGAVARGWGHDENAHKVMDPDLAFAIADEVLAINASPVEPAPHLLASQMLEVVDQKIIHYDSQMEAADHDEFICAEWAAGAMRQLREDLSALYIKTLRRP